MAWQVAPIAMTLYDLESFQGHAHVIKSFRTVLQQSDETSCDTARRAVPLR